MFVDSENTFSPFRFAVSVFEKLDFTDIFYRKLDSLEISSLLTVFCASQFFGGKIFEEMRHRLPAGKGVRCVFDTDYE
jgi:hypothetical protein